MSKSIRAFFAEEDGVTALEYGILACLIAGVLIATFKTGLGNVYNTVMDALTNSVGSATGSATSG